VTLEMRWSVAAKDDSIDARLVDRVLGEYREMPALTLTIEHGAHYFSPPRQCSTLKKAGTGR
jgi:hypothetical protein